LKPHVLDGHVSIHTGILINTHQKELTVTLLFGGAVSYFFDWIECLKTFILFPFRTRLYVPSHRGTKSKTSYFDMNFCFRKSVINFKQFFTAYFCGENMKKIDSIKYQGIHFLRLKGCRRQFIFVIPLAFEITCCLRLIMIYTCLFNYCVWNNRKRNYKFEPLVLTLYINMSISNVIISYCYVVLRYRLIFCYLCSTVM